MNPALVGFVPHSPACDYATGCAAECAHGLAPVTGAPAALPPISDADMRRDYAGEAKMARKEG